MATRWLDWTVTAELPLRAEAAFSVVLAELGESLHRLGIELTPGPKGTLLEKGRLVGRVRVWDPGRAVVLEWHSAYWRPEETTEVSVRLAAVGARTRVTLEHRGFGSAVGEVPGELAGWFASALLAPALAAGAPERLGEWVTDRAARRPSGAQAQTSYADPMYHRPNFLLLLEALRPRRSDRLVEVGCGGGALLKQLLEAGLSATGVDHSAEMLRVAAAQNAAAIEEGRLTLVEADAARLPLPDGAYTAAVSTGAFSFFPDPAGALREMRRVLAPGGRFAMFLGTRALAGTPACPEPIASRCRFYDGPEIEALLRGAGFSEVEVTFPEMGPYAKAAGLPDDVVAFFSGTPGAAMLVVARKRRAARPIRRAGRSRGSRVRSRPTVSAKGRRSRRASPAARARRG